jgi:Tol biopolymer transport system component
MARRITERISIDGNPPGGFFRELSISATGRWVTYVGAGACSGGLDNGILCTVGGDCDSGDCDGPQIWLRDRQTQTTILVSKDETGTPSTGAGQSTVSDNGRHVVFAANGDLDPDTSGAGRWLWYVHDRDPDMDDTFDEPGEIRTVLMSKIPNGGSFDASSCGSAGGGAPGISSDGRYVAFIGCGMNLHPSGATGNHVYVFDRDADEDGAFDETPAETALELISVTLGPPAPSGTQTVSMSADGRYVAFESPLQNLVPVDTNPGIDIFVRDRLLATTELVSVHSQGLPVSGTTEDAVISADGRFVSFLARGGLRFDPEDTNFDRDHYLVDRLAGTIEVVGIMPTGIPNPSGLNSDERPSVSGDGRFVVFGTADTGFEEPADPMFNNHAFVYDRFTRNVVRASQATDGTLANFGIAPEGQTYRTVTAISADGSTVAFFSDSTNLDVTDLNGVEDVYVRGIDSSDPLGIDNLLFDDDELNDSVLEVFDVGGLSTTTLCPSGQVAVAAGNAAFLRPESAVGTGNCPAGSLNSADADEDDEVVHLWTGGATATNLGRAGSAVDITPTLVAALISEADDGDTIHNSDGLADDLVVQVHPVGAGVWTNVGQAADTLVAEGDIVAFITTVTAMVMTAFSRFGTMR